MIENVQRRVNRIEVFKILNPKTAYDPAASSRILRKGSDNNKRSLKFDKPRTNIKKFTFSNRVVAKWNDLPL